MVLLNQSTVKYDTQSKRDGPFATSHEVCRGMSSQDLKRPREDGTKFMTSKGENK